MSVTYFEQEKTFMLETKNSVYAFCIDEDKNLAHLHWGEKIYDICDLPTIEQLSRRFTVGAYPSDDLQEYRGWGGYSFTEPSLKARFSDGTRNLFLKYESHEIKNDNVLEIVLKDTQYPIRVTIVYKVYYEYDIIERNSRITNDGNDDVFLEQAFSAEWRLPFRDNYELTYFTGRWAAEYQMQKEDIKPGSRVLETRTGLSGPDAAPFFMINEKNCASENFGGVYFYTLLWSGNWKGVINKDKSDRVIVTGGINNFDFEWCLGKDETFETPVFAAGYTSGGYGQVSRNVHDYERNAIMTPVERDRIMPVLYNAYGTYFQKINEERILGIIDKAKSIGIELLVMDAGWQGVGDVETMEYRKGMGTWEVNKTRFPNGLKVIADKLHENGMLFGLWMEPETVHPESPLLKEHPEYILKYTNRQDEQYQDAYVLNFAMDEVRDYMTEKIIRLVEENDVDCFKIDFNRFIPHAGWQYSEDKHQKEVWVRYVRNIYKCYTDVKTRYPNLLFENCAAGGMRIDLAMLKFSGRINRSDNQDTLDVLKLHEGFSYFMLPKLAGGGCHISDVFTIHFNDRISPMKYQAHAAMLGSMAIGKNLSTISDEESKELKEYVDLYKEIRHIVHLGDLYRLVSPREKSYAVYEYVTKDKNEAVIIVLGQSMQFCSMPERLRLQGLSDDKKYVVENYGTFTGQGLKNIGIQITLNGDMRSEVIKIKSIEQA